MFTYTTNTGQVNGVHEHEQVFGLASMVDFGQNDTITHARKSETS